jgi:hypothetical protein
MRTRDVRTASVCDYRRNAARHRAGRGGAGRGLKALPPPMLRGAHVWARMRLQLFVLHRPLRRSRRLRHSSAGTGQSRTRLVAQPSIHGRSTFHRSNATEARRRGPVFFLGGQSDGVIGVSSALRPPVRGGDETAVAAAAVASASAAATSAGPSPLSRLTSVRWVQ